MTAEVRKNKMVELAEFIAMLYLRGNNISLESIVHAEGITLHYDDYERAFDGMLTYDDECFYIHIDNSNGFGTRRGRFTLAHELAHYFIDEHRIGLLGGKFPPHGSRHDLLHKDPIEVEADYFASSLLMPAKLFRAVRTPRNFSIDTIFLLSNTFETSFLSTVIRFAEIGNHSLCVVVSQNNICKWFTKSRDFPDWAFRCRVGGTLPPTTVAGEFFKDPAKKYTGIENVAPEDWFYNKWPGKTQMHEQCYYSDSYGYVISFIWFE